MTASNDKQRNLRLSLADLEVMTTHQIAELLGNFVLLLRRLPDVPFSELGQLPATDQEQENEQKGSSSGDGDDLVRKAHERVNGQSDWWTVKDYRNYGR